MVEKAPIHLRDGGVRDVAGVGGILQRRMPTGGEGRTVSQVAGVWLEEVRLGRAEHGAEAEVGVKEGLSDEVEAIVGEHRAGGRWVW